MTGSVPENGDVRGNVPVARGVFKAVWASGQEGPKSVPRMSPGRQGGLLDALATLSGHLLDTLGGQGPQGCGDMP